MGKKFWKNKKVLVTGHEGFIGSWLTKILIDSGASVIGCDLIYKKPKSILKGLHNSFVCLKGDISDFAFVRRVINKNRPEVIFHLAAEAIVGRANKNPLKTFKSNIQGTWNILEASRGKRFIKSLIVASSDKAYGFHKELPYTEDAALKGNHPYDVSKSCTDLLANTYFNSYRLPVCVTRCGNVYGPGDLNFSRLVPDAICSLLRKKQFAIRSDGKFTRDYIYVEDVVRGYILVAEKMKSLNLSGEAFNFSNQEPITVLELFGQVAKILGEKIAKPKILNKAKYEIRDQYLSAKKAKSLLGWKPEYSFREGLRQTIDWYSQYV
jgi:CDP-glucose 4,6-dehydratase